MPRPYILSHSDKWFVFLGCALVALCTSKEEALAVQRDWIHKSQAISSNMEEGLSLELPGRPAPVPENGKA